MHSRGVPGSSVLTVEVPLVMVVVVVQVIRVWDPRTREKQFKLKGHTDNIKAIVLDPQGRYAPGTPPVRFLLAAEPELFHLLHH